MSPKKLLLILSPLIVLAILFLLLQLAIHLAGQPTFFPLDNPNAKYTVVKSSKMTQGWEETIATNSSDLQEPRYYVEYRGKNVLADDNSGNFFRITVGNSKVDLQPYIDKNVRIIKGEFASSSKQCIAGSCIDIFGLFAVLTIDQLTLVD